MRTVNQQETHQFNQPNRERSILRIAFHVGAAFFHTIGNRTQNLQKYFGVPKGISDDVEEGSVAVFIRKCLGAGCGDGEREGMEVRGGNVLHLLPRQG